MTGIRELARDDEREVRAYWELNRDAVAERPYNTYLAWQAARSYIATGSGDAIRAYLVATDGPRLVGSVEVQAPTLDNTHMTYAVVAVAPDRRREGIGSRLLGAATDWSRGQGRRLLTGSAFAPVDGDSPGLAFVRRHNFEVVLEDGMKAVDLQATRGEWTAMAAEVAPHHAAYRLVTSWEPVPDELMEGYCALNTAFVSLAPMGDAEVEDEHWDEERVREREARTVPAGRHDLLTAALDADGRMVALTELIINETAPNRAFQGGTLALPEHRGHRLGLAVKLANHAALVSRFPQVEWMVTGNADVNAPMNAINDRLGYRVVERCLEVQKSIEPAAAG